MQLLLTFAFYIALDLLWVGLFAKPFIARQVGQYLSPRADWLAAILFYLIFCAGLWYFAIPPARTPVHALLNGAFFGLVTYGINRALLANWPRQLVAVDMAYGVVACGLVAWSVHQLAA